MAELRNIVAKIVIDCVCLLLVFLPWIVLKSVGEPYKRGFFCDDQSLRYPYHSSTVTTTVYASVCFVLNFATIFLVEAIHNFVSPKRRGVPFERYNIGSRHLPMYLVACYKAIGIFLFGAAIVESVTNIGKFAVGRLRPHFFDICQPDFSKFQCNDTHGLPLYITEFECLGPRTERYKEARLSFPSGHTSFSTYAAVFFALYLQSRLTWKGSKLLKHLFQAAAIYAALYVSLSRISDYKHHWSDVLGGFFIGVTVAISMGVWVAGFFRGPRLKQLASELSDVLSSFQQTGVYNRSENIVQENVAMKV